MTYLPINHKEFQAIKKGDVFYGKILGKYKREKAANDAFYNADADDPKWEVEAVSGAFYCKDNVYKKEDPEVNTNTDVYKIGQILTSNQEVEVEMALSGEKVIIPKGNKIIIGPDKFAHHIRNGMMQPLQETAELSGYDTIGLAEYLYIWLKSHFPIDEMLEEYDSSANKFKQEIEVALDEIGF